MRTIIITVASCVALLMPLASLAQKPVVSTTAPTSEAPGDSRAVWTTGSSASGATGVHRVEGAYPAKTGDLVLILGGDYSLASDLFVADDRNERQSQFIAVAWTPVDGLTVWLRQSTVSNRNAGSKAEPFDPATTQNLGDPTFGAKYAMELTPGLGVGGGIVLTLPTSARGTGVNPEALIFTGYAAASYLVTPFLAVSINAGYRLDKSDEIFPNRDIPPVARFTANISSSDAVVAGLGADTYFELGDDMAIGPFAELSMAYGLDADFETSPMRASLGAKLFPFGEDAVELAIGGDYAIAGTPAPGSVMAGIPPWAVFGRVVAHLGPHEKAVVAAGPMTCANDAECADGQVCIEAMCGRVKEVIKEVVKEVEKPVPTFTIEGGVFDQTSGDPVGSATVKFSSIEGSPLAVDYRSGKFKSWPIPVSGGLIKVTAVAPGYRAAEQTVPKGKPDTVVAVAFKLQSSSEQAMGEIKGSLKDSRSGNPIKRGHIFIPILNQKIRTDKEGKFAAAIKAGRYQVLISHKRYVTQKKEIEIRAGDVVILNVDMNKR